MQSTLSSLELSSLEKGPMHRSLKTNKLWNRSAVGIGLAPDIVLFPVRSVTCRCFTGRLGRMGEPTMPHGGGGRSAANAPLVPTLRGNYPGTAAPAHL